MNVAADAAATATATVKHMNSRVDYCACAYNFQTQMFRKRLPL